MMATSISCVIPALNEAENIERLISSILSQQLGPNLEIKEIIVVDNGSQDNTTSLAQAMGASVYVKPKLTIGALRNFGAKKANGEVDQVKWRLDRTGRLQSAGLPGHAGRFTHQHLSRELSQDHRDGA